ncbi:MAG: hypothetical protein GF334_06810 [Candidatus Altiarchaeales archaeon]|nr:hypothetical protein [Candidatus Altiarchaeales archaeon]
MKSHRNKGLMGVGTLIIFIAIILIAAVASSVLITTGGSLQQKALVTGVQTEESVASGVEAISLMATDASENHSVQHFELLIRMQSGSEPINLNNSVITVDTTDTYQNLDYNTTIDKNLFSALSGGTHHFIVQYVKQGPDNENGYLNRGDVVKLKFNTINAIDENQKIRIRFIPRVGQMTQIDVMTPDVMSDQRVQLWPT